MLGDSRRQSNAAAQRNDSDICGGSYRDSSPFISKQRTYDVNIPLYINNNDSEMIATIDTYEDFRKDTLNGSGEKPLAIVNAMIRPQVNAINSSNDEISNY